MLKFIHRLGLEAGLLKLRLSSTKIVKVFRYGNFIEVLTESGDYIFILRHNKVMYPDDVA